MAVTAEGKMVSSRSCKVVMVLGALPCYASLAREGNWLNAAVGGVYRLDDPGCTKLEFKSLPDALAYIRDHGGEWIAGEPLPEKPEEVWAQFRHLVPGGSAGHTATLYRCGKCLFGRWGNFGPCPSCGAKLALPQDWVPVRAEGYPQ